MENKGKTRDFWEVRRGGEVLCASPIPFLGYPAHTLLDIVEGGCSIYRNGKRVKKCELASA